MFRQAGASTRVYDAATTIKKSRGSIIKGIVTPGNTASLDDFRGELYGIELRQMKKTNKKLVFLQTVFILP